MTQKQWLGTIAILLATIIWGMTFAFIKDAVSVVSPFDFLFLRFGIASALLLVIFFKKIVITKTTLMQGLLLGLFLGGTVIFQTIGLRYTTASTASFITGFSVVLVAIFESVLNKRWPSFYVTLSAILATIGIGFITLSNGFAINQGDFWVLLCAFCFAVYILLAGRASKEGNSLSLTLFQSIFITGITAILSEASTGITIPHQLNVWIAILFCSVFASIIAFILQLQFQQYVSSSKAAMIFALEPVFATITAAIYLKERLTFIFFIGALLILSAIILSERGVKEKVIPQD